jgi:outer membrane protein OmpA-like peptidoglycan-associated protein
MRRLLLITLLFCFSAGLGHAADKKGGPQPPAQRYVVFFQEWSAALDDSAQAVITQAAEYAKAHPAHFAHIGGFADPTGSQKANALLSDLRMQVVVDQLRADGVPAAHIIGRGHGAVPPALSSQESRRVEISFGTR